MKKISILGLLVLYILAVSCAFAFDPITLRDEETGNTAELYATVDEEDKGLLFYANDRLGFSVKLPEIFTEVVCLPGEESGTMILESKDGKSRFKVSGGFEPYTREEMLSESYSATLQAIGGVHNTTYHDVGDDYWQMHWREGETLHKRKFLTGDAGAWCECEISYVTSEEGAESPLDEITNRAIQSLGFPVG